MHLYPVGGGTYLVELGEQPTLVRTCWIQLILRININVWDKILRKYNDLIDTFIVTRLRFLLETKCSVEIFFNVFDTLTELIHGTGKIQVRQIKFPTKPRHLFDSIQSSNYMESSFILSNESYIVKILRNSNFNKQHPYNSKIVFVFNQIPSFNNFRFRKLQRKKILKIGLIGSFLIPHLELGSGAIKMKRFWEGRKRNRSAGTVNFSVHRHRLSSFLFSVFS